MHGKMKNVMTRKEMIDELHRWARREGFKIPAGFNKFSRPQLVRYYNQAYRNNTFQLKSWW